MFPAQAGQSVENKYLHYYYYQVIKAIVNDRNSGSVPFNLNDVRGYAQAMPFFILSIVELTKLHATIVLKTIMILHVNLID